MKQKVENHVTQKKLVEFFVAKVHVAERGMKYAVKTCAVPRVMGKNSTITRVRDGKSGGRPVRAR